MKSAARRFVRLLSALPLVVLWVPTAALAQTTTTATATATTHTVFTGVTLVDADADADLRPLLPNDTIDLSAYPGVALTIRADVVVAAAGGSATIISAVEFDLDSGRTIRSESVAPYFLGGDVSGNADAVATLLVPGAHTLTVTAMDPSGAAVDVLTVAFAVVASNATAAATNPTAAPASANDVPAYQADTSGAVNGELKKWHKITVGFLGPVTGETNNIVNPFTDFRLDVTFTHAATGKAHVVPGYYACDGNAANSGAVGGLVWLVHFRPDEIGNWTYAADFTEGVNVAVNASLGTPATFFDGASGSFVVAATDKTGRDLRGKGLLQYVGEHHLRFAENGEYFIKAGSDAPENFFAYSGFDNTPNNGGYLKDWAPHEKDYVNGDPTWNGGKGRGIIGAVNYLSSKGMNVFSFLTMNIGGDDKNVFPYISDQPNDFGRMDCSKTAQWDAVMDHAETKGMYLHFKTQETENDQLLDGGELGNDRKLYYRELIARFGHHLALNWNLGEENTNTDAQRKAFSDYFKEFDPLAHPVVMHTFPGAQEADYAPLLGYPTFDGASLQTGQDTGFSLTLDWVTRSAAAGRKWIVSFDEQSPSGSGVVPDADDPTHDGIRKNVLWANIMVRAG